MDDLNKTWVDTKLQNDAVGRVGGGCVSWNFLRMFPISFFQLFRSFWTISTGLNGSGFYVVTSGGAFGCGGSDGTGFCG